LGRLAINRVAKEMACKMSPNRAELEGAVAHQYGFDDYAKFREFFAANFGKGMLNKLEAEFKKKEKENPPS
jgi:hypothetical protein